MLFIPCLIAVLSLSAFKSNEVQKISAPNFKAANGAAMFTDIYVWTTIDYPFIDLDGVEYQDFYAEFIDENQTQIIVSGITLNYRLTTDGPYGVIDEDFSKFLYGSSNSFLVEDNVPSYDPANGGTYYYYTLLPGDGHIIYGS